MRSNEEKEKEKRKEREIDIINLKELFNDPHLKHLNIDHFKKSIINRYYPLNHIDIKNEKYETFSILKRTYFNTEDAYFFTFESLDLIKLLIRSWSNQNLFAKSNGSLKNLSLNNTISFEKELIDLIDNNKTLYGKSRLVYSQAYLIAILNQYFGTQIFEKLDIFLQLISKDSQDYHKSKVLAYLTNLLNSTTFNMLTNNNKGPFTELMPALNDISEIIPKGVLSLDEQIVQNIIIENTIGFTTPFRPNSALTKNSLFLTDKTEDEKKETIYLLLMEALEFSDDKKHSFFDSLTLKKDLKKNITNYFKEVEKSISISHLMDYDFLSNMLNCKKNISLSYSDFKVEYSEFFHSLNSSLSTEDKKQMLFNIDEFIMNKTIDIKRVEVLYDNIAKDKNNYDNNNQIYDIFNSYLTSNNLSYSNVADFKKYYYELLLIEKTKKEKELNNIKSELKQLKEISDEDIIDKFQNRIKVDDNKTKDNIDSIKKAFDKFVIEDC